MMSIKTGIFMKSIFKLLAAFFIIINVFIIAGCKMKPPIIPAHGCFVVIHKYSTPEESMPMKDIPAFELVSKIYVGWNLGNTLGTADLSWLGTNPSAAQMETA
jgi:hypothetical protein